MRAALYRPARSDCQHIDVVIKDLTIAGCRMLSPADLDEGEQWMIDLPGLGLRPCRIRRSHRRGIRCEFQDPLEFAQIAMTRKADVAAGAAVSMVVPFGVRGVGKDGRFSRSQRLFIIILAAAGAWMLFYAAVRLGDALFATASVPPPTPSMTGRE
ncbi:hypothetical protein [Sphingobium sp. YBL2]|uniref:hypothetical protein n=1 Tax=Sphingobium sp. (strain YBL2) TaxID=484429 RepID=UPI00155DA14E|nr:hypothetical protein [Sphingobium sp. YBL2]